MKKSNSKSVFLFLASILAFMCSSFSVTYSNPGDSAKDTKMERIMANYEFCLNSKNPGVRMSAVEHVGRYKMSNFENKIIEMLKSEQNTKDKQIIALCLFQLGTLNSIEEIRKSDVASNDVEYKEFCSCLLNKYWEYDKLRSEYFENQVVYTFDIN